MKKSMALIARAGTQISLKCVLTSSSLKTKQNNKIVLFQLPLSLLDVLLSLQVFQVPKGCFILLTKFNVVGLKCFK